MIKEFKSKARILFFPKAWGNAVARWIMGIVSPSGTIKIKNTVNPTENGSLELDVNMDAVCSRVRRVMEERALTRAEMDRIKGVVRAVLDGVSIKWKDGLVGVDADYLKDMIEETINNMMDESLEADASPKQFTSGYNGNTGSTQLTDTHAFGSQGATIQLLCRSTDDGADGAVFFRTFTITADGRIVEISGETSVAQVVTHA